MIKVTPEELENFRSQLADYPEALAALDEIEEDERDLEDVTEIIALEAGIGKDREEGWLEDLARRVPNIISQDEFRDDLLAGVITALLASIAASGNLPVALATAVAIYIVKIGVISFCNATEA